MAETRDAVDTITGYYYQFDYYILKLLKADDNDLICIEGIEDVDITGNNGTSAIQCKYYAKTVYNHSVKKGLINEGICLIDGFDYLGTDFSSESLTRKATYHNGIKIKVINELELLVDTLGKMSGKKAIYQFYIDDVYVETDKYDIKYIPCSEKHSCKIYGKFTKQITNESLQHPLCFSFCKLTLNIS